MPEKIRVLVVDDSAFMRNAIRSMLQKGAEIEVVGVARDGEQAIEEARRLTPDIITLDVEMPKMDGLTALPRLRRACEAEVIMVSSLTAAGSHAALAAMRAGAAEIIAKDVSQISLSVIHIQEELLGKVRAVASRRRSGRTSRPVAAAPTEPPNLERRGFDLVVIGSSTGGPPALERFLEKVPAGFTLPMVIAQHMPVLFTKAMAERFANLSPLNVLHAEHNMPLLPGHVYVAPGGVHSRIRQDSARRLRLEVSPVPRDALYKPSVDELVGSAAEACRSRVLAIILTGMGDDGLVGARKLHGRGGVILAQDADSCVVFGMPKAVTEAGLVHAAAAPEALGNALAKLMPAHTLTS